MTVHLVCSDALSERILARLARHLVGGLGWTVSGEPNDAAECNVFWPYLEYRKHAPYTATPTAAWFTHYEPTDAMRARAWAQAAEELTLRVTPALQYARRLEPYGPTAHISHPVELDKFMPVDRQRGARPVVGVAGYVYPGGRKGEGLVARLAQERVGWRLMLSGQGWPVDSTLWPWGQMQEFYQGLDVFLVTSLIEGGPVTMLEALACGVPVVVPSGVGACDELPEIPGIHRYRAGDYDAMMGALSAGLEADMDRDALRGVVAGMTAAQWCRDWTEAIEATLGPAPAQERGIYTVAYGVRALECAAELIRTIHDRGYPVAVASDAEVEGADVSVVLPRADPGARDAKTRMYELSPWAQTIYADADTLAVGDIGHMFTLLDDGCEVVLTASPDEYATVDRTYRANNLAEFEATMAELPAKVLLQPSGGVLAFRRCIGARRFLERWHAEWQRWGTVDQLAMMRALYAEPPRYAWLDTTWNYYAHHGEPDRAVGFLHFPTAAREWGDDTHRGRRLWEEWKERV